jgi:hypothetical protein
MPVFSYIPSRINNKKTKKKKKKLNWYFRRKTK